MTAQGHLTSRYMALLKKINVAGGVPCEKLPNAFFPEDITDPEQRQVSTKMARALCKTCPILQACFTYALETNQQYGVWGGTTADER